jgi:uncharacterized protein YndB with AHSA1/START domain
VSRGCDDPVSSRTFHLLSCAKPQQVWEALTCPLLSPRFLHGFSVESCWTTGAPLTLTPADGPSLTGQVLHSHEPTLLSLTIEDPCGSCTYLTWQLRAACAGTVIRLTVEELGGEPEDLEQLEDAWLPALRALEHVLQG